MQSTAPVVTRVEIANSVRLAFDGGPVDREAVIAMATSNGARREVIAVLHRLPARQFTELRQLWQSLQDVPVDRHA